MLRAVGDVVRRRLADAEENRRVPLVVPHHEASPAVQEDAGDEEEEEEDGHDCQGPEGGAGAHGLQCRGTADHREYLGEDMGFAVSV